MDKATGDDDVPTEFFQAVQEARQDLYAAVRRVFNELEVMQHVWKLIESGFVEELAKDTELFLEPSQEGSRPAQGARSNILRARIFIDITLKLGIARYGVG